MPGVKTLLIRFVGGPLDGAEVIRPDSSFFTPFGVRFGTTHAAWYVPTKEVGGERVVYRFEGYREV